MGRLLGGFGFVLGALLIPLALAPNIIWLVLPGHIVFSELVCTGAFIAGFQGNAMAVRLWGGFYALISVGLALTMDLGSSARESWYWMIPWTILLMWGWIPAVVVTGSLWLAPIRARRLDAVAISKRRRQTTRDRERAMFDALPGENDV